MIAFTETAVRGALAFAVALASLATAPAHANTATSAAVEVKMAVEEADSPLGKGDEQFKELFAKWEKARSRDRWRTAAGLDFDPFAHAAR